MLAMLCARCQQREAKSWPQEQRAELEQKLGVPWPFPDDVCKECYPKLWKEPEFRARLETFRQAMWARARRNMEQRARQTALKLLDVADAIAGKL